MIETKSTTWYEARRGELLAEQFLLDLMPQSLSSLENKDIGFDYMAFFRNRNGAPVAIGVEVKSTQREIKGNRYDFSSRVALSLLESNLPVLILIVDVKDSTIYFNWINNALSAEQKESLGTTRSCKIYLREATKDEIEKLRGEIMLQ